jgi:DHA1 family multidrug resistance protein-like MFS transporter
MCSLLSAAAALITVFFIRELKPPPESAREPAREPAKENEKNAFRSLAKAIRSDLGSFLKPGPLRGLIAAAFAIRFGAALADPILAIYIESLKGYDEAYLATTTGLVFGATAVATLLFAPMWGRLGDRHGHGLLLAVCATGAGAFYVLQSLVFEVKLLYALRFASGSFLAGIFPSAYALAARHSPVERRGGAYGLTFASFGLANAAAPLSGGVLSAILGVRSLFLLSGVLMLLASAPLHFCRFTRKAVRESSPRTGSKGVDFQRSVVGEGCTDPEGKR